MNHNKSPWQPVYLTPDPNEWVYYDFDSLRDFREALLTVGTLSFSCGGRDYCIDSSRGIWTLIDYRTGAAMNTFCGEDELLKAVFVPQKIPFMEALRRGCVRFFEDMDMGEKYGWKYRPQA